MHIRYNYTNTHVKKANFKVELEKSERYCVTFKTIFCENLQYIGSVVSQSKNVLSYCSAYCCLKIL